MILKFVVDFVDGQAVFLDAKETSALVSFCLRLLQIYSSHNIGKVTPQVPYDSIIVPTCFFLQCYHVILSLTCVCFHTLA
jgi:hypothetical protein